MKKLLAILLVAGLANAASAAVLYYNDCDSIDSSWTYQENISLTSDGNVVNLESSAGGLAIAEFGTGYVDNFTIVYDFKFTDPGSFSALYAYNPGEGMMVDYDLTAKDSRTKAVLEQIAPDTWYTMGIYYYGAAGYMAYWVAEGKGADLWAAPRALEVGAAPWAGSNRFAVFAYGDATYGDASWQIDNIQVNEGVDFAQAPEPATMSLLLLGGIATVIRRKK